MPEELRNIGEEYQRLSKDGFDAATRSLGEVNKGFQALAAEMTDYSKRTFDDVFRAWEQLLTAKSLDQVIEIQSQYAKKAYDTHMSEMSKLGEMYVSLARNAYKPVEQAVAKKAA
jgi:phasin family protein